MPLRPVRVHLLGTHLPGRACGEYTDIHVALQVGKEYVHVVPGDESNAVWETTIQLGRDDGWVFRGPAVHGPRGQKFFYLAWNGRLDGAEAAMFRRAKLMLDGLDDALLTAAEQSGVLRGTLGLTDGCGMPRCAAVRPPVIRWEVG